MSVYAVIASGPSLTQEDVSLIEENNIPIIACNNSWKLTKDAVVYGGDCKWWDAYINEVPINRERWTHSNRCAKKYGISLFEGFHPKTDDLEYRLMWNSGQKAIELAISKGATTVILLGFDGCITHGSHWHGDHPQNRFNKIDDRVVTTWNRAYLLVKETYPDINIINCSRYTEVKCFKTEKLENVLSSLEVGQVRKL